MPACVPWGRGVGGLHRSARGTYGAEHRDATVESRRGDGGAGRPIALLALSLTTDDLSAHAQASVFTYVVKLWWPGGCLVRARPEARITGAYAAASLNSF